MSDYTPTVGELRQAYVEASGASMAQESYYAEQVAEFERGIARIKADALRAVADLHQPRNKVTRSASGHLVDTPGPCAACDWDWPCTTITAIQGTLGEE